MRRWAMWICVLLGTSACGDDGNDPTTVPMDAGSDADSSTPPSDASMDAGDAGDAGGDPTEPPAEKDGMRLFKVRFDVRAGSEPFRCDRPAALGTANTMAEPADIRFYVHDVELIRAGGERVALELYQDDLWQRENVALLDFADDTGKCATGNADLRPMVYGYAEPHTDYSAVAFKLGIPADKNHLDSAEAPAPYNASGMWWSWAGGYKYMRLDVIPNAPEVENLPPIWYFHAGATGCQGSPMNGFTCTSRQIASIELLGFEPSTSVVTFDVSKFYENSDLTAVEGSLPGCMSFQGDPQCIPLFASLGVVVWDDEPEERPTQTAFDLRPGEPWQPSNFGDAPPREKSLTDPTVWPDPNFERSPLLDVARQSEAEGDAISHAIGDPRHGVNCMRCHQENGPGIGQFIVAGSIFTHDGQPATGVRVQVFDGVLDFVTRTYDPETIEPYVTLEVDANGNFFTTELEPYGEREFTARILGADDEPIKVMTFKKGTGACNTCHTGGFRLQLPAPSSE